MTAIIAFGFPVAVLLGGGWALDRLSGRASVIRQLTSAGRTIPQPLNMRWLGYGPESARTYWSALQEEGRRAERKFLRLDLLFPFFYGGSLATSLRWAWLTLEGPFPWVWIAAPLALAMIVDWVENLIQLNQLGRYRDGPDGDGNLQRPWIRAASCATVIKLWFMGGLYMGLGGLVWKILTEGAP